VAQAEAIKCLMDFCANHPTCLDSSLPCTTPPPPLALPLEQAERLVQAMCLCARASIMRRLETFKDASEQGADQLGAWLCLATPPSPPPTHMHPVAHSLTPGGISPPLSFTPLTHLCSHQSWKRWRSRRSRSVI
jgi:hypothetical protein